MENLNFYIVKHSKERNPQEKFLGYSQTEEKIQFKDLKNLKEFFLDEGELNIDCFNKEVIEQSNINPLYFVKKILYYVILIIKTDKHFFYKTLLETILGDKMTFHISCENSEFSHEGKFIGFSNSIREIEREELYRLYYFLEKNMEIAPSYFKNDFIQESDIFFQKHVSKELIGAELVVQIEKDFLFESLESLCEI